MNSASQRRADGSPNHRALATPPRTSSPSLTPSAADTTLDLARQHRDRLLNFQSENARRTHIIDEAADFETPTSGQSMWSSPAERAAQLKRQQKVLREQEWDAKPEYEKRRVVVSVDLVGGKVIKKMADISKPIPKEEPDPTTNLTTNTEPSNSKTSKAAFSNNPLMGNLIRPIWKPKNTTEPSENTQHTNKVRTNPWRRVQDDDADNEAWILDGGVYGNRENSEQGNEVKM